MARSLFRALCATGEVVSTPSGRRHVRSEKIGGSYPGELSAQRHRLLRRRFLRAVNEIRTLFRDDPVTREETVAPVHGVGFHALPNAYRDGLKEVVLEEYNRAPESLRCRAELVYQSLPSPDIRKS